MKKLSINKGPLGLSVLLSGITALAFYFIDNSVASLAESGEMAASYVEMLSLAKWLIIAGILIKGLVSGISFRSMDEL